MLPLQGRVNQLGSSVASSNKVRACRCCVIQISAESVIEKSEGRQHPNFRELLEKLTKASEKLSHGQSPKDRPIVSSKSGSSRTSTPSSESVKSETDDSSEDDSASEIESEKEQPSPIPLTRPLDPGKAKEYDIIKTVWARRNRVLSGTVIRTALGECWDILKWVRNEWNKKLTGLQQAIEKKDTANKAVWQRRVVESRKLFESCVRLTTQHGHPSIVERVAENPQILVVFFQFLADRIKESEYSGGLVTSILELVNRCNSLDTATLERTKIDRILGRITKRGDDTGRDLAQKILDKAAATSASAKGEKTSNDVQLKGDINGSVSATEFSFRNKEAAKVGAVVKKEQDEDKKISKKVTDVKPVLVTKPDKDGDISKVKVIPSSAKPTSFFAGLQSASKKPGTSTKGKEGKARYVQCVLSYCHVTILTCKTAIIR